MLIDLINDFVGFAQFVCKHRFTTDSTLTATLWNINETSVFTVIVFVCVCARWKNCLTEYSICQLPTYVYMTQYPWAPRYGEGSV